MLVAVLSALAALGAAAPDAPGDVVLRIGDSVVTRAELDVAKRSIESRLGDRPPDESGVLRLTVNQLIANKLLAKAARKARISVPPAEVEQRVAAFRSGFESGEEFEKALGRLGVDEAGLARREEEQLMVRLFITAQIAPLATPTEEEAKAYYDANTQEFRHPEQVRLRMILVKVASDAPAEQEAAARARVEEAIRRLGDGGDFAKVARELSEEENSREQGGELETWIRRGLLAPGLEEAAFALRPGERTGAIRTSHGYHVLRLEARREAGVSPFEEVKERLMQFLRARNTNQLIQGVVAEMRAANPISAHDPAVRAALASPENASAAP